jgi:type II secretory pathway component HofQ
MGRIHGPAAVSGAKSVAGLHRQNAAQILARPYISTRSTKPAKIEIVSDQFARVNTTSDESSIIGTDSVTAGITLNITPIVMSDQSIRLDLAIEDSRFGATAGEILITKNRNTASTSMNVNSGQTIIIGGLNSRYRLAENSGLPWLRNVPVLNMFAANRGAIEIRNEVMVYLTPYIWLPGLETPLPLPGTPVTDLSEGDSTGTFGPQPD